jgi:hypothetical protein
MTDWNAIAAARGIPADERVTRPIEALEAQFAVIVAGLPFDTEPAAFPVLPIPEKK